jgi:hypothetical protein
MLAASLADLHRLFLLFGGVCTVALVAKIISARRKRKGLPLPPGPKPLPVVGNLRDIPQHDPWKGYKALTDQYGMVARPILLIHGLQWTRQVTWCI